MIHHIIAQRFALHISIITFTCNYIYIVHDFIYMIPKVKTQISVTFLKNYSQMEHIIAVFIYGGESTSIHI